MRKLALMLLLAAAVPAFAAWDACPTTCNPPTGTVSGLSRLPLYSAPVKFGGEVKIGGGVVWLWTRVNPAPPCTPAQLANVSDKVACAAKVGEVLPRTPRVKSDSGLARYSAHLPASSDMSIPASRESRRI